ncbi:hypothetical protein [Candidatus Protochlamydia phocaeensis]|uniref:hypothetical protein n=1 Tax=Candidatus Protochlamydia phocaeensis TaxID=1414722 RepID=UPI000839A5B8|nr:hypothetical protein [Candidatus Protochlamydia phocaeensis]
MISKKIRLVLSAISLSFTSCLIAAPDENSQTPFPVSEFKLSEFEHNLEKEIKSYQNYEGKDLIGIAYSNIVNINLRKNLPRVEFVILLKQSFENYSDPQKKELLNTLFTDLNKKLKSLTSKDIDPNLVDMYLFIKTEKGVQLLGQWKGSSLQK